MVITAIAIAIAGIPSGLPAAITVVLVIGMQAVLQHNGLVRNMLAAETLGSTTWILTDKTGTLTNGVMSLSEIITADTRESVQSEVLSPSGQALVRYAYLATDGKRLHSDESETGTVLTGSSIEQAIVTACEEVCASALTRTARIFYTPFEAERRASSAIIRSQGGNLHYLLIGAPEYILEQAVTFETKGRVKPMHVADRERLRQLLIAETEKGRRVIALGTEQLSTAGLDEADEVAWCRQASESSHTVTFKAFLSLEDSVREDVTDSVSYIRNAGVTLTW